MPILRNAPCPCGSGLRSKHCCHGRKFHYEGDADVTIRKGAPLPPDGSAALATIAASHEAGTSRPLEFIEHACSEVMKAVGIHPAIIHAVVETGLLLCHDNARLASGADLDEWDEAIERWEIENGQSVARRVLTDEELLRIGARMQAFGTSTPAAATCPKGQYEPAQGRATRR
jgi:hypothetical protein